MEHARFVNQSSAIKVRHYVVAQNEIGAAKALLLHCNMFHLCWVKQKRAKFSGKEAGGKTFRVEKAREQKSFRQRFMRNIRLETNKGVFTSRWIKRLEEYLHFFIRGKDWGQIPKSKYGKRRTIRLKISNTFDAMEQKRTYPNQRANHAHVLRMTLPKMQWWTRSEVWRKSLRKKSMSGRRAANGIGGGRRYASLGQPKFVTYRDSDVDEKTVKFLRVSVPLCPGCSTCSRRYFFFEWVFSQPRLTGSEERMIIEVLL